MDTPDLTKINPFDFDQKIGQLQDHLDSTGAPADQSAALISKLQEQYKTANEGEQDSGGVAGTGFMSGTFNNALASQGETPGMYDTNEANNSGIVLSPLQQGQNRLLGIPKILPNAISDTGNVAMGLASAVANPVQTIKDIYHDPTMLAGPALQELGHGTENALSDLLQGNFSKSGTDFLAGLDKTYTGFVDHPILSLPIVGALGEVADLARDVTDKTGITTPKPAEIDPTTGKPKAPVTLKSDIAAKTAAVKSFIADPKATAVGLAQRMMAPFKGLMPNATGDAAANIIADRIKTSLGQINNLDEANETLASKPDFEGKTAALQNAQQVVEANKVQAVSDLVKAGQEDTALAKGVSHLTAPNTTELVQSNIKNQIDGVKSQYSSDYNNLKAADGTRIPVRDTQGLGDAISNFQKENGSVLDQDTRDTMDKYQFLLKAQDLVNEGKTLAQIKDFAYKNGYAEIMADLPGNIFHTPLSADQLAVMKNDIVESIQKGMPKGSAGNYVKMFSDAVRQPFNDILDSSVNPVNPQGADAIRTANAAFAQLQTLQTRYGLNPADGSFSDAKIQDNWEQFKKDFPKAADAYGKMKAKDAIAFKMDDMGNESINYKATNKNLEEAKQFIPSETYAQIKSIITKHQTDTMIHAELMDKAKQASDAISEALTQTQANAKVAPTSPEDFEDKVMSIKKLSDLNTISKTTGIPAPDLGNVFIAKSLEANFGEGSDLTKLSTKDLLNGATGFLKDYDKIGGGSKTSSILNKMFGPTKDTIEQIRTEVERAKTAQKEGGRSMLANTAQAGIGVIAGMLGHVWMASALILRAARDSISERTTEPPEGTTGTVFSRGKEIGKNIVKKAAIPVTAVANAGQNNE